MGAVDAMDLTALLSIGDEDGISDDVARQALDDILGILVIEEERDDLYAALKVRHVSLQALAELTGKVLARISGFPTRPPVPSSSRSGRTGAAGTGGSSRGVTPLASTG
jgi:hypothetical protein